jgi:large subunit ribosomal protein L4
MATAPLLGGSGSHELDESVFGEPFHGPLVHETVRAELNARRQGTHSTLTRGEVAMTGAKAFRQKGTGRARAGALSTPQRTGGGVAFGPKPRSYTTKVNRKARRRAMRAALSVHADRGSLAVVDVSVFETPSTKRADTLLREAGEGKALIVVGGSGEDAVTRSFRNLPTAKVLEADRAGVADVIGAARLIVSPSALDRLTALAGRPGDARTRRDAEARTSAAPGPGEDGRDGATAEFDQVGDESHPGPTGLDPSLGDVPPGEDVEHEVDEAAREGEAGPEGLGGLAGG